MKVECNPPVLGRMVWGHPHRAQPVLDRQNNPRLGKDGQPRMKYSFGMAYPKAEFDQYIRPFLQQAAMAAYPHGQIPPTFAWKFKDGDTGLDKNGQPLSAKPGYAGHYILSVSTEAFAPTVWKKTPQGTYRQMPEEEVKCGHYYALTFSAEYNGQSDTAGLYINPVGLTHEAYGEEIVSSGGFDPNAARQGVQYAMPAGASVMPVASASNTQPTYTPSPAPVSAPVAQPQYVAPPVAAPVAAPLPAPAHDFVQNVTGQPVYTTPPAPVSAPVAQPQYVAPPVAAPVGNAYVPPVAHPIPVAGSVAQPTTYATTATPSHTNVPGVAQVQQ